MPKPPRETGRKLVRAMGRAGFVPVRTEGDHLFMHNPRIGRTATIVTTTRDLPVGTLASILRQAGITAEELRDLLG